MCSIECAHLISIHVLCCGSYWKQHDIQGVSYFQFLASVPVANPRDTAAISAGHIHYHPMTLLCHTEKINLLPSSTSDPRRIPLANRLRSSGRDVTRNGDCMCGQNPVSPLPHMGLGGAVSHRSRCLGFRRVPYPCLPNVEAVSYRPVSFEVDAAEHSFFGHVS